VEVVVVRGFTLSRLMVARRSRTRNERDGAQQARSACCAPSLSSDECRRREPEMAPGIRYAL